MPLYIMLSSLSETGRQVIRKLPGSIRKVNAEVGRMGARVIAQYAVLGPYDFVTVLEAPDNETVSRISVELGARGSVQMMTMPAIPVDDFISRLASPSRRGGAPADGPASDGVGSRGAALTIWAGPHDSGTRSLAREGQTERD
jgi:uncharacterized protein with GYD domain